jgi:hypothetical protein
MTTAGRSSDGDRGLYFSEVKLRSWVV